jgi:hypothetical protein
MNKLSAKLKEEFFALLPPTIFFFVVLHIVAFVRVLIGGSMSAINTALPRMRAATATDIEVSGEIPVPFSIQSLSQ